MRLFKEFERLSEAPDAVDRLRRFVLNLAVLGKLVEQDPDDESVSDLLRRQKGRWPGRHDNSPVPELAGIPASWRSVPLGDVAEVLMGQSPPGDTYNTRQDGLPLINGPVEFTSGPFGRTVVNQYTTAPTKVCDEGDLLICVRGSTTGRTNIAGFRACIGRGVAAIRSGECAPYVNLYLWNARDYGLFAMNAGVVS
jgi:restriction endonuclease S subunit